MEKGQLTEAELRQTKVMGGITCDLELIDLPMIDTIIVYLIRGKLQ